MDLLNQSYNNRPQRSKGSKLVMIALIICILLVIIIVALMIYLQMTQTPQMTLRINGNQITLQQDVIVSDSNGNRYISLKDLSDLLGYKYNNGAYMEYEEDKTKCYIDNNYEIIGFNKDSSLIYKTTEDSQTDYEYYKLNKNILEYQEKLYIALEDLNKALNLICDLSNANNITIETTTYASSIHAEQMKETNYILTSDNNNLKALAYGMLVVSRDSLLGVLNQNHQEIIGNKYRTMEFNEYNMTYIVSNERNQYGIITTDGNIQIALRYDSLRVINYEPLLYEVSQNKKYGIMKEDGQMLTELEYDRIGYPADLQNKINYTLIIPDLDGRTGSTIVVCKDGKYGLVYLTNGKAFLECDTADRIYAIENLGEIEYRIQIEDRVFLLEEYIEYARTQTMIVN